MSAHHKLLDSVIRDRAGTSQTIYACFQDFDRCVGVWVVIAWAIYRISIT